jgi:hypothetical protein
MPVINKNGARKFHPPCAICAKNCAVIPDENTRFLKRFSWSTGKLARRSIMMSAGNARAVVAIAATTNGDERPSRPPWLIANRLPTITTASNVTPM